MDLKIEIVVISTLFILMILSYLSQRFYGWVLMKGKHKGLLLLAPSVILHELCHLSFAMVTLCKNIRFSLFTFKLHGGELGYVNYSYNPNRILHQIRNALIGLAPLTLILLVITYWFYQIQDFESLQSYLKDQFHLEPWRLILTLMLSLVALAGSIPSTQDLKNGLPLLLLISITWTVIRLGDTYFF